MYPRLRCRWACDGPLRLQLWCCDDISQSENCAHLAANVHTFYEDFVGLHFSESKSGLTKASSCYGKQHMDCLLA